MGAFPSTCDSSVSEQDDKQLITENGGARRRASSRLLSSGETVNCPTCQGTGRIPRGQENKLVAVIPCNDQRLKPRHTKLYVGVSVSVCLLVSALVLFFLFPRSVLISPVAVKSSFVYFSEEDVKINITNVLNITNHNFGTVHAYNLTVQAVNFDTVVGSVAIKNVTSVKPLSMNTFSFLMPIKLTNSDTRTYCMRTALPVHTLLLELQISMTVYYLAHYEQISVETFEFINCRDNSTTPHSMQTLSH